ncbi:hypothetical protein SynMINOS11_00415 [Synechococcus sp. Minos11]|nr:hypothetical protein SynMINOS11_00415 [Synechococcus sp. Minos11]
MGVSPVQPLRRGFDPLGCGKPSAWFGKSAPRWGKLKTISAADQC